MTVRLVVFGHNDWWVWERQGFCTRNAALVRELAGRPGVEVVIVVDDPRWAPRSHRPASRRDETVSAVADGVVALRHDYRLPLPAPRLWARRINDAAAMTGLRRRLAAAGAFGGRLVLWVADPRMVRVAQRLPRDLLWFDAIDDWREHPWAGKALVDDGYRRAAQGADLMTAVNLELLRRLQPHGRAEAVHNAVDAAKWVDVPADIEVARLPRPVAGYVGMLQRRVDLRLLCAVAERLAGVSFVLAGPVSSGFRNELERLPTNVHLLDARPGGEVPALVAGFDVGLVPHVDDALTRSMDPLKMYEYLAAGKPVVSTVASPNPALAAHIRTATSPDAFAATITAELAADDEERRAGRRSAVRDESWAARASRIIELLAERLEATGGGARA